MGHSGDRVETRRPIKFDHRSGAQRCGALSLHLHDGYDQAVGGRVRRANEGGQPLGGQQQLSRVLRQALLPFASTSQVYQDVVVIRQTTNFIIWQACLKPAERADDDTLRGVPKVYDLVEAFGTDPVATLQHFGFPLLQVVPIVTDLALQLIRDLSLHRVLRQLTGHLEQQKQLCADVSGQGTTLVKVSL